MSAHCFIHDCGHLPKSFSTFAFTLSSILMSGGQGRLKPSPGNFFVASMPSLLPLAISLVAWPSTSMPACSIRREPDHFKKFSANRIGGAGNIFDPTHVGCYAVRG